MKKFKTLFLVLLFCTFFSVNCAEAAVWVNNLRDLFASNKAVIYEINIRTFNAKDKNNNGIIEEGLGEERGSFLNAIDRLNEVSAMGFNTVHVMPVTATGKTKALGTAGSLYAAASFNELNPQLKSPKSSLTIEEEMKRFVEECHARGISVIVDLPSCGAYDLYLRRPELFKKDKNNNPIVPSDWTDVRLLDAGSENKINMDVYGLYQEFIDLMIRLGVDGIRADVATIKPYSFWKKLIDETRKIDPQFFFLAEASPLWKTAPSEHAVFTPYNKLLEAGFDGYYGSYFDIKNWKTAQDLYSCVNADVNLSKTSGNSKSVIGSFATHDQLSPILVNGPQLSNMIIWLSATLPLNPYFLDGFQTGDTYIYPWANKKASKTYTDDEYYFAHRGQFDIFNFSRKPQGKQYPLLVEFLKANKIRNVASDILGMGDFTPLKTSTNSVFAYTRSREGKFFFVVGNLDFKKPQKVVVNLPKINEDVMSVPIKISKNVPILSRGKVSVSLDSGEIQVIYFMLSEK